MAGLSAAAVTTSAADRAFHRRDASAAFSTFTAPVHFGASAAAGVNHAKLVMPATPAAQTDMVRVVRWFMGDVVHRLFSFRFSISTRRGSRPCDLVGRFLLGLYPSHIRSAKRGLFALVDVLANPSQLGATWANVGERVASLSSLPLIVALPRLNRTDQ